MQRIVGDASAQTTPTKGVAVVVCTYKRAASLERLLCSLAAQTPTPAHLVIVDASPDAATAQMVQGFPAAATLAATVDYVRVTGSLRGLTRQRNLALGCVQTDLVAFFDDDVVLLPGCLHELEQAHRATGDALIGVGALITATAPGLERIWHLRRIVGIVPHLRPGRYHHSGFSTPWHGAAPGAGLIDGDWLPGCAAMWRTATARAVGFHEPFGGYAQGEDLDFSLQARRHGRLVMNPAAQVVHLHAASGRPHHFRLGYMAIYNRYHIHRRAIASRTWRDVAWFIYAWLLDTGFYVRHCFVPQRTMATLHHLAGRLVATGVLVGAAARPRRGNTPATGIDTERLP